MRSIFIMLSLFGLSSEVRSYRYVHLDVFTDRALTGNQLAVFLAPEGLSAEQMLLIAREMNFSESTFVLPAEAPGTDFRVRIFTTSREIDFAGHPTIGTAFALARAGKIAAGTKRVTLGEGIGPVPVDLEWEGPELRFAWMYQKEPVFGKTVDDLGAVARALGVETSDIAATGVPVQEVDCGARFLIVPMSTRAAVDRAALDRATLGAILEAREMERRGVFIYSNEPGGDDATVYSRMLSFRGIEDPATGSASGPLGAYLVHHGVVPRERAGKILSRQGVQMGRPSRVSISIGLEGDKIKEVRVGGASAFVGEGTIELGPN
jgi:trans-2,3-dihydro-3-hydroxyanthranilate isomerase